MNTENTREIWNSVLQLDADKTPLQNLVIDPESSKYYLTHKEYNMLLEAVKSLINEYTGGVGEQGYVIQIKGSFDSWTELSTVVEPELGDGYLISGDLWIYDDVTPAVEGVNPFGWNNVGKMSGESAYFHIAYADSVVFSGGTPISISGFSSNDYAHKAWLGTYADHNEHSALEAEWLKYKWTHIKGNDGPGQEFIYKLMNREPTSSEPIPVKAVDDNSDDNVPTGWTDNPQGHTPLLPYEWVSIRKKKDGVWGAYTRPVVWTNYAKPGDPGAPGIAGPEGPSIVFRGTYNGTQIYYGTSLRRDIVVHSGVYYITKKSLNGSFTNKPVSNTLYWEPFGANFDSVATNLLLAEEANIAGFSYLGQKMVSQNGYVGSTPSTDPSDSGFIPNLSLDGITGTIHARQGSIGGFELTKNYLQSTETGTGGNKNLILNGITGELTANDATIRGHIEATSGTFAGELTAVTGAIGGFNIEAEKLITYNAGLSGVAGVGNDNPAFWAGGTYAQAIDGTAKSIIRHDGSVKFTEADITGNITAASGGIGGIKINANSLGMVAPDPNAPSITEGIYFDNATLKLWQSASQSNRSILITTDGVELATYSISGSYNVKLETSQITVSSNIPGYDESILTIKPDGIYKNGTKVL